MKALISSLQLIPAFFMRFFNSLGDPYDNDVGAQVSTPPKALLGVPPLYNIMSSAANQYDQLGIITPVIPFIFMAISLLSQRVPEGIVKVFTK